MKTENDSNAKPHSPKKTKQGRAKELLAQIKKNRAMQDIYNFVQQDLWEYLGYSSLKECLEKHHDLPRYPQIRKIYNAVDFQITYLPDSEVGEIKEGVLRPICTKKYSDIIKKQVAVKMSHSTKEFNELTQKDIEGFIKSSMNVLNRKQKKAALEIVKEMLTQKKLEKIDCYLKEFNMNEQKQAAFFQEIGRQVRRELNNQQG